MAILHDELGIIYTLLCCHYDVIILLNLEMCVLLDSKYTFARPVFLDYKYTLARPVFLDRHDLHLFTFKLKKVKFKF